MVESVIGLPIIHDKYSYCHGRSTLATTNNNIAIYFNLNTELDKLLINELPKYYKDVIILNTCDSIMSEYILLIKCMYLAKYIAEEKNVVKNGVLCDGISIHLPETKMENEKVQSVFGVIYMDTLEEMKEMENLSFEQVVERIIEVVWKNSPKLNDFPKNDKEVLKKITIGFQRTEYNSNMLKRKSDFDGIEEYLYIMTEDGKININDDFLKYFNVPVESAWRAAEENTKRDSIIFSMADFFKDVADVKNFIKIPLYVVTNKEMKYSASAIINKERLSDYCHEIDINKIVVIPSSIHEMLFLPWDEEIDERYMDEMIQEVNDTVVSPIEQLGNKSYIMEV